MIRGYMPDDQIQNVLSFCHDQSCGEILVEKKTAAKVL